MSINQDPIDPDNVLWFWFRKAHRSSKSTTKGDTKSVLHRFERFLAVEGEYEFQGSWTDIDLDDVPEGKMMRPRNVDNEVVYTFFDEFLSEDYSGTTQQATADHLSRAYQWCIERTTPVSGDPVGFVLEEHPNLLDKKEDREPHIIDIEEARRIITDWDDPRLFAANLMLAKTTRRIGGVLNLDLRDVNLDHPACDWTVHSDLRQWPDHIVFPADKEAAEPGRRDGNKTKTTHLIPIDDELKDALLTYLAVRRGPSEPQEPLFRGSNSPRLSKSTVDNDFREMAKKMGHWYRPYDDDNIGPHYWRHWTTTSFEDRLGKNNSLVTYFRGDIGDKSKGGYNHWTKEKERLYREHVPKFFTGDVRDP